MRDFRFRRGVMRSSVVWIVTYCILIVTEVLRQPICPIVKVFLYKSENKVFIPKKDTKNTGKAVTKMETALFWVIT